MKELEQTAGLSADAIARPMASVLTDAGEGLFQHCLRCWAGSTITYRAPQPSTRTVRHIAGSGHERLRAVGSCAARGRFVTTAGRARAALGRAGRRHIGGRRRRRHRQRPKAAVPGLVVADLGAIQHVSCASPSYFKKFGRPKASARSRRAQLSGHPSSRPKSWPFPEIRPGRCCRGERFAVIQQQRRADPDGAARCGIIRVPVDTVRRRSAEEKLEVIFRKSSLSPERMGATWPRRGACRRRRRISSVS